MLYACLPQAGVMRSFIPRPLRSRGGSGLEQKTKDRGTEGVARESKNYERR